MSGWIGIDPGLSGAIAFLYSNGLVITHKLPVVSVSKGKNELDMESIHLDLAHFKPARLAVLEEVNAMPSIPGKDGKRRGMGATSAFRFGDTFGCLRTALVINRIPVQRLRPQAWKKLLGMPPGKGKEGSIARAKELFPGVSLVPPRGRVESDALAEALLLAECARRLRP